MMNLIIKISTENGKLTVSPLQKEVSANAEIYEALFEKLGLAVQASANKEYGYVSNAPLTSFQSALKGVSLGEGLWGLLGETLSEALSECFSEVSQDHYLWVTQSQQVEHLPIGLFLLKHDASYFFSETLELNQTQCIDPGKFKYAAIVDPIQWQQQSNRYVTLMTPKSSDPIAEAFTKLMGFTAGIDRKADTEEFLQMIQRYADEVIPDQKKEVAPRVFKYCSDQDRQGRSVNIQKLSEYMDEQAPEAFAKYVAANLETPPTDWHPDRRQVQKHTKFFGRDQNISISFSSMMFGDDIEYDERTNSLTIRSLPKSLVKQIERYLRKCG